MVVFPVPGRPLKTMSILCPSISELAQSRRLLFMRE
jgi:hypothetical protein